MRTVSAARSEGTHRKMCGIVGIWNRERADPTEAARLAFFALYALQHRGQESAGIAATDGRDMRIVRRMGLVGQVFSEPDLGVLGGRAAIGHTRYSTTGSSRIQNAQPMVVRTDGLGELAISHNGNCINARDLREGLSQTGVPFTTSSDTEVIAQVIAHEDGATWDERLTRALPKLQGAWSLVILTPSALYAVRDPLGVRPLCLGRKGDTWLVASETCALETVGARFIRDVAPGEVLRIDDRGPVTVAEFPASRRGLCVFEHVYLASVASDLEGVSVYATRERMGETLAVELLRTHGATEVHMRICSPPLRHQCFFGVDMARRDDLIASRMDVEAIRQHIGADSLGYLSLDGMVNATGGTAGELCTACFTGDYLVPVQLELGKDSLESEPVKAGA